MIAMVNAPASSDNPHFNVVTKNSIPKSPYTIDGIPDKVSVVRRITPINRLPLFAYSTRKMAEKIPKGTAMISESSVIATVLTSAGNKETLSELYSSANKSAEI